jgi:hypothetical protein
MDRLILRVSVLKCTVINSRDMFYIPSFPTFHNQSYYTTNILNMSQKFEGKVVLITGAASGIG